MTDHEPTLTLDDTPTKPFGRMLRLRGIGLVGFVDDRTADEIGVELDRLNAAGAPKLEQVVTLPEGKGQVWARFDTDGTPHADYRENPRATWMPVDMLGGSVEVAP